MINLQSFDAVLMVAEYNGRNSIVVSVHKRLLAFCCSFHPKQSASRDYSLHYICQIADG